MMNTKDAEVTCYSQYSFLLAVMKKGIENNYIVFGCCWV